jgi:hypothetical protein
MSRSDPAKVMRLRRSIMSPCVLIARGLFRQPGEPGAHKEAGRPVDELSQQAKMALVVVFGSLEAAKAALAGGQEPDYTATLKRLCGIGR